MFGYLGYPGYRLHVIRPFSFLQRLLVHESMILNRPTALCDICKHAPAQYSCPSCNWTYCSIACFRDAAHSECSEKFYRASVLGQSSASDDEKLETMRILKRLQEDEQGAGEFMQLLDALGNSESSLESTVNKEEDDNEDDEDDKLAHALENINLDNLSTEEIFKLLGKNQAEEFLSLLRDAKASQELLKSLPVKKPWWERPFVVDHDDEQHSSEDYTTKPDFVPVHEIPKLPPSSAKNSQRMLWNIVATLISYAYVIHTVDSTGVDTDTSVTVLRQLVPFLFEHSSVVYQNLEDVLGTVFATIDDNSRTLYLNDTATLLAPRPVTILSTNSSLTSETLESHQNRDSLRALSHLSQIVQKSKKARLKCLFYIALLRDVLTPNMMREVSHQIRVHVDKLQDEQKDHENVEQSIQWMRSIDNSKRTVEVTPLKGQPLIQELK